MKRKLFSKGMIIALLTAPLSVVSTAQAQAGITTLPGMPATVPAYGGQMNTAALLESSQSVSQGLLELARQSDASPEDIARLSSQLNQMNTELATAAATGQLKLPSPNELSALGIGTRTPSMGFSGQSFGGQSMFNGGGIESLGELLSFFAAFVPGAQPIVDGIMNTVMAVVGTVQDAQAILALFQNVPDFLSQFEVFTDINSMLGGAGSEFLKQQLGDIVPTGLDMPNMPGMLGLNDIQSYVDRLKTANFQTALDLNETLLTDTFSERTGLSKYANPLEITATLNEFAQNMKYVEATNKQFDTAGQSAETMAQAEEIANTSADLAADTRTRMNRARAGLTTAVSEIGVMRRVAALVAEQNNIEAANGAAITAALSAQVRAMDANTAAVNQLVTNTIEERKRQAAIANQNNARLTAKAEERARQNALATQVAPQVVKSTSLEGEYDLRIPEPYGN